MTLVLNDPVVIVAVVPVVADVDHAVAAIVLVVVAVSDIVVAAVVAVVFVLAVVAAAVVAVVCFEPTQYYIFLLGILLFVKL